MGETDAGVGDSATAGDLQVKSVAVDAGTQCAIRVGKSTERSGHCSKCVGKVFVAKGAPIPSGKSAADVVKEEQLPPVSRVIKHSDGIPSAESNPNRLTLVLSRDGTIASAIWD